MSKVTTIGDRVKLKKPPNAQGVVKFIGEIKGKNGIFYGIELDEANSGTNNGLVQNIAYFKTTQKRGMFVKKKSISKTNSKNNNAPRVTVGDKVNATKANCFGIIRYIGEPDFKSGIWYGIQLEEANGKNNGTVKGKSYFECNPKYGTFVKNNGFQLIGQKPANIKKNSIMPPATPISPLSPAPSTTYNADSGHNNNDELVSKLQNNMKSKINDMNKVINVLNGDGTSNDLDDILNSYNDDDNKENDEWVKIVENFKKINEDVKLNNAAMVEDIMKQIKYEKEKAENEQKMNSDNNKKLEEEISGLKDDKKNDENKIKTLEEEIKKIKNNGTTNNTANMSSDEKDEKIEELRKANDASKSVIRSKDDIIANATEEIKRLKKELREIREEEEKEELQLDSMKKEKAKQLLMKRVEDQQSNALSGTENGANIKKKTVTEMLHDATENDGFNVISSMNVLKFDFDKREKRDIYTLDMINNSVLKRLTNDQRDKFMLLLGHCIANKQGGAKIERVKLSNMGVDDKLFPNFMDILIENSDYCFFKEFWYESNKMGDEGMKKFAQFVELNTPLEIVKMYNNKSIVSTPVINTLLDAMNKNTKIIKFTFEWRLTQHRDKMDKALKRNGDLKRKAKWGKK